VALALITGCSAPYVVAIPIDNSQALRPGFLEFHVKDAGGDPLFDESGPVQFQMQNVWASIGGPSSDGTILDDEQRYVRETATPQDGFVGGTGPFVWSRYYHHTGSCEGGGGPFGVVQTGAALTAARQCWFDYRVEVAFEDHGQTPYDAYNFLELATNADNSHVNSETPDSVISTVEPWAGCADGDAAVVRVSGPVQDTSGDTATLVMADCTNSLNWTSAYGN
jgi:hypothetical protein